MFRALLLRQQGAHTCRKQLLKLFRFLHAAELPEIPQCVICVCVLQTELGTVNYTILNKKI